MGAFKRIEAVITGNERITLVGDQYRVRRSGGETLVPANLVLRLFRDTEEAYQFLRGKTDLNDPDERLRLAKWCLDYHLRTQAEEEQRLLRMAIDVALAVGGGAVRVREDAIERFGRCLLGARRGRAGERHQRNGESGEGALQRCGHSAPERTAALTWALRTLLRFIDS